MWFSEASIWELGLKWRKGKIGLQPRRIVEQALRDRFRPLPITLEAILLSGELRPLEFGNALGEDTAFSGFGGR